MYSLSRDYCEISFNRLLTLALTLKKSFIIKTAELKYSNGHHFITGTFFGGQSIYLLALVKSHGFCLQDGRRCGEVQL